MSEHDLNLNMETSRKIAPTCSAMMLKTFLLTIKSIISASLSSGMCLRMADNSKLYLVNLCIGRTRISASRNLNANRLKKTKIDLIDCWSGDGHLIIFLNKIESIHPLKFNFNSFTYYIPSVIRTMPNMR